MQAFIKYTFIVLLLSTKVFAISERQRSIEDVARQVRNLFETNQIDQRLLQRLYQEYNPNIEDIGLFLDRAKRIFPNLNCGLTTVYLKAALKEGKIVNGKYNDQNHTFLLIEDMTLIVDITADQYGGPPVYVGPLHPPWDI